MPPHLNLDVQEKTPKGICREQDLYRLPDGGVANGKTGDGIERMLARQVDERLPAILDEVGLAAGRLLDSALSDHLLWLLDTFLARSPRALSNAEASTRAFITNETPTIRRMLDRALTSESKRDLAKHLDRRLPAVAARAGLDAVVGGGEPLPKWQGCEIHVVHAAETASALHTLGLSGFPTFEQPVVEWGGGPAELFASFSLSPTTLAIVVTSSVTATKEMLAEWAAKHSLQPLRLRTSAICQQAAAEGPWLTRSRELLPWEAGS